MQYFPPRGPVQTPPDRHEQSPEDGPARLRATNARGDDCPSSALQWRLLPLTEPSLHTNCAPEQCATPPLLPLQG